jgi:hypothetical protein
MQKTRAIPQLEIKSGIKLTFVIYMFHDWPKNIAVSAKVHLSTRNNFNPLDHNICDWATKRDAAQVNISAPIVQFFVYFVKWDHVSSN